MKKSIAWIRSLNFDRTELYNVVSAFRVQGRMSKGIYRNSDLRLKRIDK